MPISKLKGFFRSFRSNVIKPAFALSDSFRCGDTTFEKLRIILKTEFARLKANALLSIKLHYRMDEMIIRDHLISVEIRKRISLDRYRGKFFFIASQLLLIV